MDGSCVCCCSVTKFAEKWAKQGPNVWHEKWGEDYDGKGACQKYTDKVSGFPMWSLRSLTLLTVTLVYLHGTLTPCLAGWDHSVAH